MQSHACNFMYCCFVRWYQWKCLHLQLPPASDSLAPVDSITRADKLRLVIICISVKLLHVCKVVSVLHPELSEWSMGHRSKGWGLTWLVIGKWLFTFTWVCTRVATSKQLVQYSIYEMDYFYYVWWYWAIFRQYCESHILTSRVKNESCIFFS